MRRILLYSFFLTALFYGVHAEAATLNVSPATGVYAVGTPFTISVRVNTSGASVNAADGVLTFNPKELQVVSVSRAGSVFNLWVEEPAFSNSAGTISFGGGLMGSGYTGNAGTIMTATVRAVGAGTPKIQFRNGTVTAFDGQGTNVLTAMNGGSFTIAAAADAPAPEYIPPANTPQAPQVKSSTHPDSAAWYKDTTAKLSWSIPQGVTAIRTLLDKSSGSVPTVVYDEIITEKTVDDLPQGISYFHIQFKNADGWGRITHYRLAVDSEAPKDFVITETESETAETMLLFVVDDASPITEFKVQLDGGESISVPGAKEGATTTYALPHLMPGYHTVSAEAIDSAGNTRIATYAFTVAAFEKPQFTEYPNRINTEVIPALKGVTRPNATVFVEVKRVDGETLVALPDDIATAHGVTVADADGAFTYIPDGPFAEGVYEIRAVARDEDGRVSEPSEPVRVIVEVSGIVAFGTALVRVLSVIVPLIALILLLIFGSWYLWHRLVLWKRRVAKEANEAEAELTKEFHAIITNLNAHVDALKLSRKNKLLKAEEELIAALEQDLKTAQARIGKEIADIEKAVR